MKVAIIGAGPAGLAIAGRLKVAEISFDLFDQAESIGDSWQRHYDRLKLHTVKKLSQLPHLSFPKNYPQYVSRDEFIEYQKFYSEHFELEPILGCRVTGIRRSVGAWRLISAKVEKSYDRIIFATGVNHIPNYPNKELWSSFEGKKIHSREYKNSKTFEGKRVLIIGMGNTGAELALDLANSGIDVAVSVRSKVNIVPLEFLGRSSQKTALMLEKLPLPLARTIAKIAQRMAIGDLSKYGLPRPELSPVEQLKQSGRTPIIDLGTVDQIKKGNIKVFKDVVSISAREVGFTDNQSWEADIVIFCTGYRPSISDILGELATELAPRGFPKSLIGKEELEGLYFMGYDLMTAGGVLRAINRESEEVLEHLKTNVSQYA